MEANSENTLESPANVQAQEEPKTPPHAFRQWTRTGLVDLAAPPYYNFDALTFNPDMKDMLCRMATGFMGAQQAFAKLQLPWRAGCFLYGPPGCGKTAASHGLALLLGWQHVTIQERDILDANALTHALFQMPAHCPAVITIENIDAILKRIDSKDFFEIFDEATRRAQGSFWVATTNHPDETPKNLLVRPGRFEESVRLTPPAAAVREQYLRTYIMPLVVQFSETLGKSPLEEDQFRGLVAQSEGLSFAHFVEMRQLVAHLVMSGQTDVLLTKLTLYCQEQVLLANRWGEVSQFKLEVEERVRLADPRMLSAALQVTDVFKKVLDYSLSTQDDLREQQKKAA